MTAHLAMGSLALLGAVGVGAGIAGGLLAGLLGVGGGIVIVPALYLALTATGLGGGSAMQVAVATSLATIVFTALSSSRAHHRRGAVDIALLRRWAPWVVTGVVLGSLLGAVVDGRAMVAVFAAVALVVAANMLFGRGTPAPEPRRAPPAAWAATGVFAGGVSALMGIGGGTVCVPVLSYLGYDIRRAVGTSSALGLVIGLPGTVVYVLAGLGQEGLPPYSLGYVSLPAFAVIVPFTTYFATWGARIAHAIPMRALRICFGLFLAATAMRMILDLLSAGAPT
jgi:uncharacterized membrane protein YfcA